MFQVTFPGGVAVDATYRNHTIHTDQPVYAGGTDSAPAPFDLFLASIATCAGFYALRFCQERGIDTTDLGVSLDLVKEEKKLTGIKLDLRLPAEFPEKYREAIIRAVDQCAVKRAIMNPPRFEVGVSETVKA